MRAIACRQQTHRSLLSSQSPRAPDQQLPGHHRGVLTTLFLTRDIPKHIRSNNGPQFIAPVIRRHPARADLEMLYIEPGSPWQNGFAESFFSRLRDELLNVEEFVMLSEARWFAKRHLQEHNQERPHSSLGYRTPSEFALQCAGSVRATPSVRQHPAESLTQPALS